LSESRWLSIDSRWDKLALLEKFAGKGTGTLRYGYCRYPEILWAGTTPPDASGPSFRHWIYPTTSTTINTAYERTTGIMTLDDVAQQNREPDFFELLQAGIPFGITGCAWRRRCQSK